MELVWIKGKPYHPVRWGIKSIDIRIKIPYSGDLSAIISESKFSVDKRINANNFPSRDMSEQKSLECSTAIWEFECSITTETATEIMKGQGYRPASVRQLIVYPTKQPRSVRLNLAKSGLTALGSYLVMDDENYYPAIIGGNIKLVAAALWSTRTNFLAIKC
jgi:hypothetical protein